MLGCGCCCSDAQDEVKIQAGLPQEYEPAPPPNSWMKEDAALPRAAAAAAVRPLTDKDIPPLQDAASLEAMVSGFVEEAVKGLPCVIIDETSGARRNGRFQLDSGLKSITIGQSDGTRLEKCALARLQDVFAGGEDEDNCFPSQVFKGMTAGETAKLVRLSFLSEHNQERTVTFLLQSTTLRSSLMEGLRVLCETKP
mmetsp:Transcript_6141/g.14678  ORF Transcript_6141/g.14678 Transcript_6141/m.14678 type:complete len:197 (-) Transcript_6141:96-686(-)